MPTNPAVRRAIARLIDSLTDPESLANLETAGLSAVTNAAAETIEGADYASVTVVDSTGELETLAPTDPLVVAVDRLQTELREGPCYDAANDDAMYIADDLEGDPRWPTYGPRAASIGIRAQLGVDLHHPAGARASLNLYARNPGALGSVADDADLFAGHAALVLGYATATDHFQAALASRRAIGQALGIVMERYRIDEDRAFRFLTRVSQESNVKLREVAAEIVAGANRRNQPRRDGAESHESADADQ